MKLTANGIENEVEDSGGEGRPVVLLIMGLGMQLIAWPDEFVRTLVDSGFRVVRRDNRDVGLSQGFDHAGAGNLVWQSVRQMLAIGADSGRHGLLGRISSPTLVVHGDADPLVPIACGQDTARRILGARFVSVPGMGHDLPPPLCDILLQHIIPFMQTAEERA